ncbi:MAG: SEC-C metal-binding domain-containing protein, partial [Chlamydiales bacterium]
MDKVGRNDPCPCGSGKKYKKCCEEKTKHKKFDAQILPTEGEKAKEAVKAAKLSSGFFQKTVFAKPSEPKPLPHTPPHDHPPT